MNKFKVGECVVHKLTGEHLLILESILYKEFSYIEGYYVRANDYSVIKVADFELKARNI